MKLSIIIPCYNEDKTINLLLNSLFKVKFPIENEIIIVDDGSKNNQIEFIREEVLHKNVRFVRLSQNQGKGVAIRIGLYFARGDILIIQDADLEYFPSDIPKLLRPILNKQTQVVYGTRFFGSSYQMAKTHLYGNIFLTKLTNFLYNSNLSDMETGYKMFTRKILNKLNLNAREFEFEPEITAKILLHGFSIIEIPIKYKYRNFGVTKINWLDGLESALILIQYRLFIESKIFRFLLKIYKYHIKNVFNKILKHTINKIYFRL